MSNTTRPQLCGKCGATLSGYAPDGLCAACLLESAFETPDEATRAHSEVAPLLAFNDYELLEEIARGGMGVVYRARQISLNRPVAIKMILGGHLANAAEMKRFRAEAQTAAQLQHPNIVAIHEVGEHVGQPFFSMDLVEGRNLAQLVRDEPLPSGKAGVYLKSIAETVHYAHSRGVLHRDLKPSNVLIDQHDQPRITDFGLAKRLSDPQLTQTGQVLGSPSFIPPEQAAGQKERIGPASDVYSLGAILYHCLTARPPFVAETLTQTLRMVAEQEPVSPRLLNASVPRDLETICLKCLEKDPQRRYTSAQELAEELGRFLRNEPIHARPVSLPLKVHRWCLRNKPLATAGMAILALLLIVAIGSPIAVIRINRERNRAEANATQARSEAMRSQQVSRVLKEMLLAAGPSVARGRDAAVLREILAQTAERLSSEINGQPLVQGEIFYTMGLTYEDMGDFPRAAESYLRAVSSYGQAFPGANTNLALALVHLGRSQSFTGNVAIGKSNAALGLKMARDCADTEVLIECLRNYARSLTPAGMGSAEQDPFIREALELDAGRDKHPIQIAANKVNLAGVSTNNAEVEKLFTEAIVAYRQHLPPDHPSLIGALFGLGQHLMETGQFEAAEEAMRETVNGYRKIHNGNHPYQSIVLRFLVQSLLAQGKDAEAESVVREQLDKSPNDRAFVELRNRVAFFRSSWPTNREIRSVFRGDFLFKDLASFFNEVDNPAAAEALWRQSVAQRKSTLGDANEETLRARLRLAHLLIRQNKVAEAETVYREIAEAKPNEVGHYYARAGLRREAIAAFAQRVAVNPWDAEALRLQAPLFVIRGDLAGYRQLCQQIIARFARTRDYFVAERMAKACLLHPDSGVDSSVVAAWADAAVGRDTPTKDRPWFELCKSLAEYRRGGFAESARWARQALNNTRPVPEREVACWLVLAMAQKQLKEDTAARVSLSKAVAMIDEQLPKLDSSDLGFLWMDRLIADILRREAAALILGTPPDVVPELPVGRISVPQPTLRGEDLWQIQGRAGQWGDAATSLQQSIKSDPNNKEPYLRLAPILLLNGDLQGYRQLCQQIAEQFAATQDPGWADNAAKACLIDPRSGVDLKTTAAWAEIAVAQGRKSEYLPWFQLCKALSEYRQDHFNTAIDWAQKCLAAAGRVPERDAAAHLVLAMTQWRQNDSSAARLSLANGRAIIDTKTSKLDSGDLGHQWVDRLIAEILLREAHAMMETDGSAPAEPKN